LAIQFGLQQRGKRVGGFTWFLIRNAVYSDDCNSWGWWHGGILV
jgi:hypothetical protein